MNSKKTFGGKRTDKEFEDKVKTFRAVTNASDRDARSYLDRNPGLDVAIDAYYSGSHSSSRQSSHGPSITSRLEKMFDQYKDPHGEDIGIDGTIQLCTDLNIEPEDIVMLAIAYELKSKRLAEWHKQGWVDGWKRLGCDNIQAMQMAAKNLRVELARDPVYFEAVYNHTFSLALSPGQRSLPLEDARNYWALLLPYGLQGGALSHVAYVEDEDGNVAMTDANDVGWNQECSELWNEFLNDSAKIKGVSKDTWRVFRDFVRTIDANFEKYETTASWPSTIDDFVEFVRAKK